MAANPDSSPWFSSGELDDLVVPDTPEHLWPSDSPTDLSVGDTFVAGTLIDFEFESCVPETEFESFIPYRVSDHFGSETPYYGPPPSTPFHGPPPASYPVCHPLLWSTAGHPTSQPLLRSTANHPRVF